MDRRGFLSPKKNSMNYVSSKKIGFALPKMNAIALLDWLSWSVECTARSNRHFISLPKHKPWKEVCAVNRLKSMPLAMDTTDEAFNGVSTANTAMENLNIQACLLAALCS